MNTLRKVGDGARPKEVLDVSFIHPKECCIILAEAAPSDADIIYI